MELYITGIYALNLPCSLETTGDWHSSSLNWKNAHFKNANESTFSLWGIEKHYVNQLGKDCLVANHLRAILDLMEEGKTKMLKGFRKDWICVDDYNNVFMEQVWKLRNKNNWEDIDDLMVREFTLLWRKFKEDKSWMK